MNPLRYRAWLALIALTLATPGFAAKTKSVGDAEAAYTRTITGRADKIVTTLDITDTNKATRVRDLIVRQYRDLKLIHDVRDVEIEYARKRAGTDRSIALGNAKAIQAAIQPKLDKLHAAFLNRLSGELSPEQVERVKDGLTYGVVPLTYSVYLKMYPELTDEQKQQIMALLVEARELAMDGSTSDEKHAVFGKYKGKINNYLSKAGYDARKGEQNLKKASLLKSEPKTN